MNLYKTIIGCCFLLLLQNCERDKDITFEIPFEGEKLVLYGYLSPDTAAYIEVLKTQAVVQVTPDYEIDDVNALLYEEGIIVDTFVLPYAKSPIWIAKNAKIKQELTYRVSVEAEGQTISSEEVVVVEKVNIDSLQYEIAADSSQIDLKLFFTDPSPDEENYYFASFTKRKNGEGTSTSGGLRFGSFKADLALEAENNFFTTKVNISEADELLIKLYHISKEYVSFYKRTNENGSELGNQHSTQLPPWTNVIGGYGVVGSYQVDSIRLSF